VTADTQERIATGSAYLGGTKNGQVASDRKASFQYCC
jgi:hypothetical protein